MADGLHTLVWEEAEEEAPPPTRRPGAEEDAPPPTSNRRNRDAEDDDEERLAAEEEGGDTFETFEQVQRPGSEFNRRASYAERVRYWGERQPEESASNSLLPPTRRVSVLQVGTTLVSQEHGSGVNATSGHTPTMPMSTVKTSILRRRPDPSSRFGASTIQGKKTVRISVLPLTGNAREVQSIRASVQHGGAISHKLTNNRALSFAPKRLLDIENGKSILVTEQTFLDPRRYQEIDQTGAIVITAKGTVPIAQENDIFFHESGNSLQDKIRNNGIRDFETNNEIDFLGGVWRTFYKRNVLRNYDSVNGSRIARPLQLFMPLQSSYESYLISQIIEAFDESRPRDVKYILKVAFKNRNVSRIMVQIMRIRYDFWWHWYQQITWNRLYDMFGTIPIIGYTRFPATENFPASRINAQNALLRAVLGPGNWITRVISGGRQGIVTDDPNATSQNLAAESNGFEFANRNQYGTFIGRKKTNEFRFQHRLPTDESIVRTFVTIPQATLLNNGVVHVIRQLAKHWHNMLYQFSGNFAHQRQEQLNPFETLRFNMPVVLLLMSNSRGRNIWDGQVLGPFMRKLQELKPEFTSETAKLLIRELQTKIAPNVTAGLAGVIDPFRSWLDAIYIACDGAEAEAKKVYEILSSVEIGVRLGYDLVTQISWKVPSDAKLKKSILDYIRGRGSGEVSERRIESAMYLTTPRDKRTFIELVKNDLAGTKPAQLLLGRVKTLLQRELRREVLNQALRELSAGDYVTDPLHDEWYWLEEGDNREAYIYDAKVTGRDLHRFIHVDSGYERFVTLSDGSVKIRAYTPVAMAITRAQKAFMTIELDHGKKYSYDALMEFNYLRVSLRRLIVVSQLACEELDNARLNFLREIQRSNQTQVGVDDLEVGRTYYTYNSTEKFYEPFVCQKKYSHSDREWAALARAKIVKVPPQSMIVIGGGPTGLTTVIHCNENVLVSGGVMKLYEARDAFQQGGSTFERAQIVRLDGRWIGMLRYHLGTGFEDVYIPSSGETDAQLGNTLPTQGFVEITIKDLENMLHVEVSKRWSKGLLSVYTDSPASYDPVQNALTKNGEHLKIDDLVLRRIDENGNPANKHHSWKVVDLVYSQALALEDLEMGKEYGIYIRLENALQPYMLTGVYNGTYTFKALTPGMEDLKATAHNLPSIYPKGVTRHADVLKVVVESVVKGNQGGYVRDELEMIAIRKQKFTIDVGQTHVVESTGKPAVSKVHFSVTTYEPYGVCCIQGLKVSMLMHNFGETRWKKGIVDDIRSITDTNTRIIGDFTKMVRAPPIAKKMYDFISDPKDANWRLHFEMLVEKSKFPELQQIDPIVPKIVKACEAFAAEAHTYRRQTLQTRFFETGDNYYLGMEFNREYDLWKKNLGVELVAPLLLKAQEASAKADVAGMRGVLLHHIDRLWYDACLEVIRTGDVYAPGARQRVPRLYLINSYIDTTLGKFPVGESFRLSDRPEEKYEVVAKGSSQVIVRNVEGYISKMSKKTVVKREGNLTRGPNGNQESRVAMATFPVGHYVNFRCMRRNDAERGYAFAFIGDEQATPHFMRYSGLTGACINAMLFNNFIKQAIDGVPFIDRYNLYCKETNWSNGEVVQRGTGANYGEDGFLRPGFPYDHFLDWLRAKIIEHKESGQDLKDVLSRDWKIKIAASLVPRGMELNEKFIHSLYHQLQSSVMNHFVREATADKAIGGAALESALRTRAVETAKSRDSSDYELFWEVYLEGLELDDETKAMLADPHVLVAKIMEQTLNQVIEYATRAFLNNERISTELYNQPKSADSVVDDFAVEAQNFANALVMSGTLSSSAVAFALVGSVTGNTFAGLSAALNIFLSFSTMSNVSRYKIRNEEHRIMIFEDKLLQVKKGVFGVLDQSTREMYSREVNPFTISLDRKVDIFLKNAKYYDIPEPTEFNEAYAKLISNINDLHEIQAFQDVLASKFIPDTYHMNSYVQEYLVQLYKAVDDMKVSVEQNVNRQSSNAQAKHLFDRLESYTPRFEKSLQRGAVKWGFLKTRKLQHGEWALAFRFLCSGFCCASAKKSSRLAPIETETLGIVKEMRLVSQAHQHQVLLREIRDFDQLYWATRESGVASIVFISGFLIFLASIVFTFSRIVTNGEVRRTRFSRFNDVAYWGVLASAFGAFVGMWHFMRKFGLLLKIWSILGKKIRVAPSTDDREALRKVRSATTSQIVLVILRGILGAAGCVCLSWSIAANYQRERVNPNVNAADAYPVPFWIGVATAGLGLTISVLFFIFEYTQRYALPPKLGEFVCEAFRDEIEAMYKSLSVPLNDIEAKQVQERTNWEYTAREFLHKYRFDTVVAADRFGAILQYIQSGMDPR